MSNKAKRDAIKHAAKVEITAGSDPAALGNYAVSFQAAKISERNARLSIDRAIRREERSRRSIARRAQQSQRELLA